jgi:Herpesviridae UL52/UL70 DNA primase
MSLRPLLANGGDASGKQPAADDSNDKSHGGRILDVPEGTFASITSSNVAIRGSGGVAPSGAQKNKTYTPSFSMSQKGSPLPSLDKFVSEVLAKRGEVSDRSGSIRAWSIQYGPHDTPVSFTYQMQRNRFCEMVGRQHKSNNIFWTIHVDSWTCMQGCHDPDCHGWGSPVPISYAKGQLHAIQDEYKAWQDEIFEQALLNLNLDGVRKEKGAFPLAGEKEAQNADEHADALSDEALLKAVMDNPELFP